MPPRKDLFRIFTRENLLNFWNAYVPNRMACRNYLESALFKGLKTIILPHIFLIFFFSWVLRVGGPGYATAWILLIVRQGHGGILIDFWNANAKTL